MERDKLGLMVDMIDLEVLSAQPPAHTRQMAGVNKFAILLRTEAWGAHTRKVTPFALGMAPMPECFIAVLVFSDILFSHFPFYEAPRAQGRACEIRSW